MKSVSFICLLLCMLCASVCGQCTYAAWLPYWEIDDAMDEARALSGDFCTVIAFEALLDAADKPFLLDESRELLMLMKEHFAQTDTHVLLSVVNDVEISKEKYENKSIEPLRRIFGDELSMERHISRLIAMAQTYGIEGIELDYENIKSDTALWAQYAVFIEKLYAEMSERGLRLRIVLSWDTPKYVTLPRGPEYSVMCYNLYGYHSGPGPKADFAFLGETASLYASVPGKVSMAFATGGFDWVGDSVSCALTQQQAEQLLKAQHVTPIRDASSGALKAEYTSDGVLHEVWYADAQTLAAWCGYMRSQGFENFDFFRLGGNSLDDWKEHLLQDSAQTIQQENER